MYGVKCCAIWKRSANLNNIHFTVTEKPLFLSGQEVKAAILADMVRLGKEGGLKSFELVNLLLI